MLLSNDSCIFQHDDPWEDTLAVNAGYISYWGDAKADNPYDRAFDAALFTIDSDYPIRTSPSFDPAHPFLRDAILRRDGEQLACPPGAQVQPAFLEELNTGLSCL